MFSQGSSGLGGDDDDGEAPQEFATLSSLLDTEPKFRAYNPDAQSISTLERPVERAVATFDSQFVHPTQFEGKPSLEDSWGYSGEASLPPGKGDSTGTTSQGEKAKHFYQELSLTDTLGATPASPITLPQKPIYMEKYTTISSTSKPKQLLDCIKQHFNKARIDFEFQPEDSKIQALCGGQGRRCKFNVRLFRGDGEGEVLVEFQRRCGDILAFTSLYRSVLESLGQKELVATGNRVKNEDDQKEKSSPIEIPDLSELSLFDLEELALDSSSVQGLYEMASCPLVDVQKEGLSALASVSNDSPANQASLVQCSQDQLIKILSTVLESEDDEVCHTGAVLLANVCSQESIQETVVQTLSSKIINLMMAAASLANKDTKRHLARALRLLSDSPKCVVELKRNSQLVQVLGEHYDNADEHLRSSVRETLQLIAPV